ncbi:N-acetyltransferase domain-containing protein [Mycena indigotica]|uniref:N-acetyltransferase domain-containing protein n=1 Tax=Mycena indigotica TaxID=2126181 RepID=A0A8H6SX28_9AGAR|nr:N-acetyltransferase domain-containing protein [Mycena indigotica]KAF7307558.1 N-acetyltransferase domain-containing protein [Mycena indigotica]
MLHPNHQFHPLEVLPTTGEPILRLKGKGHENIVLTPPRARDAQYIVPILDDERVHPWISSVPHPYKLEDAEWWLGRVVPPSNAFLAELEALKDKTNPVIVDACPVRAIRELREDGSDVFLGDLVIDLAGQWWELEGSGFTEQEVPIRGEEPDIWTIGDYLAPSHHGRGIMSDALQTLIQEWAIPRMGVRKMVVTTLKDNKASVRVFEKCGFSFRKTIEDAIEVRGERRGVHVLEWNHG